MTVQHSVDYRNAKVAALETTIGVDAKLEIRTGAAPANCAAAATGTLLATLSLPTDYLGAAAAGAVAKAGTWSGTAVADGIAGHYRLLETTATTCHEQGAIGLTTPTTSTGTWTAPTTAITLGASNADIVAGMGVSGTGIQHGTTVASISGTSLVLNQNALITGAGVTLTFTGDASMDNTNVRSGQTITVTSFTETAGNA